MSEVDILRTHIKLDVSAAIDDLNRLTDRLDEVFGPMTDEQRARADAIAADGLTKMRREDDRYT